MSFIGDALNAARRSKKRIINTRLVDVSRLHEVEERRTLDKIFTKLTVVGVLDIGANKGSFARNALKAMPTRIPVVCVEPNATVIEPFRAKHVTDDTITVLHVAVSGSDAVEEFHITVNDEFSSLKMPNAEVGDFGDKVQIKDTIKIETLSLDSLIAQAFPKGVGADLLVKLDTQGMDFSILDGSGSVGRRACCIITEVEFSDLYGSGKNWIEHVEMVCAKGFELASIYPSNPGHFPKLHDLNAVFVNRACLRGTVDALAV